MFDSLLSLIAPHSCCGCGSVGSLLCEQCKYDIVCEPYMQCLGCGIMSGDNNLCYRCRSNWRSEGAWCVGARTGPLKTLIDTYKFRSAHAGGSVCAQLLNSRLPLLPGDITVVPVPTVAAHVRSRGFDHAARLAHQLATIRGWSWARPLSRAGSDTQHFKARGERLRTAAAGLEVRGHVPERILLVDDICTTGATLQACAQKLRENGAKQVFVAVVGRQPLDDTTDLW